MSVLSEAVTLGDVLEGHAAVRPGKVAFETLDGHSVTFGDFNRRVSRLGNAVAALGVAPGSRAAILSFNRPEYVEIFGLAKSGVILVPLNWRLAPGELLALLAHSAPEIVFVDEAHAEVIDALRDRITSVRAYVLIGSPRPGWISYEDLLASAEDSAGAAGIVPDDVLCIVYTSGTTGAPKGVAMTHASVLGNARAAAGELLGLTEDDHTMAVMPLFHAGGMWYHLFPSFAVGCTTLILAEFEPGVVLHELEVRRISNIHLVPTMVGALLAHPSSSKVDLRHLRRLFYAASSIPADLLRRAMRTFPRCGFVQSYGSTEAGIATLLDPAAHERATGDEHLLASCGRALGSCDLRVVDQDGATAPEGEIGDIEVRSAGVMKGYWLNDEATGAVLRDGWLRTGDLGRLDAEGYLYIVGRKHDMIVTGGENVFPAEVEDSLFGDPDVLEASVFGIPDSVWVERVVAAVVLRPGSEVTADELIQRLRGQLAAYKCPKAIFFTSSLPKSAVGKVLRRELHKQYGSSNRESD